MLVKEKAELGVEGMEEDEGRGGAGLEGREGEPGREIVRRGEKWRGVNEKGAVLTVGLSEWRVRDS